jgi:hypothetical protein
MDEFKDKTNDEILLEIKQMELDHASAKQKVMDAFDYMVSIEKRFEKANKAITERLKR